MSDEILQDLARRAGIAVEWQDHAGRHKVVAPPVLRGVLAALGLPAGTSRELSSSRRLLAKRGTVADLPPLVTAIAGRPTRLDVGSNDPQPAELVLERGDVRPVTLLPARGRLRVPAVAEVGYHRLHVEDREIVLAVSPARCRAIEDLVPDARLWGLAARLDHPRKPVNGDIRDLGDAADLTRVAGAMGADAVALSRVYALEATAPCPLDHNGPSSQLFLNPLHASPALVFGSTGGAAPPSPDDVTDGPQTAAAKLALLRNLFSMFLYSPDWDSPLGADFARFRAERAPSLNQHACFEVLLASRSAQPDWRTWPADLRNPRGAAVAAFADSQRDEILFQQFLQWISDRSVAAVQAAARQAGMRIGLIVDFAACVDPCSSDAWSNQSDILIGVTIGAPPDQHHPHGRNWGLTGFSPRGLTENGFAPFLASLRGAMRHAGGIGIDHATGLVRYWLIPEGAPPADGAYLTCPAADLLRLLALESVRNNVVVIGDRSEPVPEGFHFMLEQSGIHGLRVLWSQRDANAGFVPPGDWSNADVATTSAPDLPTVASWWKGNDVSARHPNGPVDEGVDPDTRRREREQDRPRLWDAFEREHVGEGPIPAPHETGRVVDAAVRYVAKTAAPLSLIPLADLLGREQPPNAPIAASEPASQPIAADALLAQDAVARRIDSVAAERPRE